MAIDMKSIQDIAAKWARVTPGRAADYSSGVNNSSVDWSGPTVQAEGAYEAGINEAISKKLFGKGVAAAGTAKWREGATTKGVARWGPGVQIAEPKYAAGFAPFVTTLSNLTLTERGPKGSPQNIARVQQVVDALRATKRGLL